MQKLRVESFSISLDGYSAGVDHNIDNPLGLGGNELHQWAFPTETFQKMMGDGEGERGIDNDFAARGFENDEMHMVIAPVILGNGERLFDQMDLNALGYQLVKHVATERATHVVFRKNK